MKYYLLISNATGQIYMHTDKHIANFTHIPGHEYHTKDIAIAAYKRIVNAAIEELMEFSSNTATIKVS